MGWTNEQKQAIEKEGANILVSAAAGSGKTSVLVARIINKVVNEKIDIDKLLVVTFTNAAASEMKQRLLNAIYEKIDENPNDENLQRQISLISHAHISTIHSFCLEIIRNNFFEIGMPANFRVADQTEIEIMKQDIIEKIFEDKYENQDAEFLKLLDTYTSYKDDQPLKDIILKIFEFTCSVPFPEEWLEDAIEDFNIDNKTQDFGDTKWGKLILENSREIINDLIINLEPAKNMTEVATDLIDFYNVIVEDINNLKSISFENWDKAYNAINNKKWNTWPHSSKLDEEQKEIKEKAKNIRDEVKESFTKQFSKTFSYTSSEEIQDIKGMYEILKSLKNIVLEFQEEFLKRKKEKNIVDFSDIEHLTLKLLVNKDGTKSEIAKRSEFQEILVDEYQDSNLIQEKILTSVSNGKNIFMVGDVKQSIYRFRGARPDLFLDKYEKYSSISQDCNAQEDSTCTQLEEDNQNDNTLESNTKIQLYKNFRSRENILNITNQVFQNIMSKKLGEIDYAEDEYLNYGANYEIPQIDCKTEMYIIDTETEISEIVEDTALEAKLVAKKIKELVNEGINYKDIAILLRSPNAVAETFEKELTEQKIPVYSDTTSEYLESIEIDTIISLLKIIDNPLQDIPLVTVLRSPIGGFSDNELIEIRLENQNGLFYEALKKSQMQKSKDFIEMLSSFKKMENELPLNELIWKIYSITGYYYYVRLMPNGKLRQANLRKLFEKSKEYEQISFKGLFNFITFIEKVASKESSNLTPAKIIGENDDVVRIMSIHKSKGLEFPVVFLCKAGKKINLQDLNDKIVYDQDLGFGVNYIKEGMEYPTLTKEAIKIKMKKETISEEMRVLYVALTRAKEKLIIIGTDKNAQENLENKNIEIEKYHGRNRPSKINNKLVEKFSKYLDWLELVYMYNTKKTMEINIVNKNNLIENKEEPENKSSVNLTMVNRDVDSEEYKKIDNLLNWKYKYEEEIDLISKTSVTALKNNDKEYRITEKKVERKEPEFETKENSKISPAKLGTLIHLGLQKLEIKKTSDISEETIKTQVEKMIEGLNISNDEKEELKNKKELFENYIKSELYKELENAKEVHKETPFYMEINNVLIQGVIDLYYISEDNKLILIDYKTDKNVNKEDLTNKYKNQLELYKEALEKALCRKVEKMCIYSTFLNDVITL